MVKTSVIIKALASRTNGHWTMIGCPAPLRV